MKISRCAKILISLLLGLLPYLTWGQGQLVYEAKVNDRVCYRVYQQPQGGFTIMGGESTGNVLLAKVDHGTFSRDSLPEALYWWLDQYALQVSALEDVPVSRAKAVNTVAKSAETSRASVAPLIKSQWGQTYPFNAAIPYDKNRYYTGCVATAMGQVMRYFNHPAKGSGRTSLKVDNLTLSANFSSTVYDFGNMKDQYLDNAYTQDEAMAMSTLIFHAGLGVNMEYGTEGSGTMAAFVPKCLSSNFGYAKSISYQTRRYYSDTEWFELIYNELAEGRPIIYRGTNVNDESRQHCFICDGYDAETGLFHFNWGWSGSGDGWFALSGSDALSGSGFNYGNSQAVVIGVQPAEGTSTPIVSLHAGSMMMTVTPPKSFLGTNYQHYVIAEDEASVPAIRITASIRNSGLQEGAQMMAVCLTNQSTGKKVYVSPTATSGLTFNVVKSLVVKFDPSFLLSSPGVYTQELVFRPKTSSSDDDWKKVHLAPDVELPTLQIGGTGNNDEVSKEEADEKASIKATLVKTVACQLDRPANKGNLVSTVDFDRQAVCDALGVGTLNTDMIYAVRGASDELLSNWLDYDGWFDAQGVPVSGTDENAVVAVPYSTDGVLKVHTDPRREMKEGQSVTARWAYIYGGRMVYLEAKVNIVAPEKPVETKGVDYTSYIVNPDFTGNDLSGWQGAPWSQYEGDENAEHFSGMPDTYQEITGLPKGIYLLEVDGLDRMGHWNQAVEWYNKREVHGNRAVIYANSSTGVYQCAMRQLMDGARETPLNAGVEIEVQDRDGKVCYIPDNMVAAGAYFRDGRYRNGLYVEVGDDGVLTIGVTNSISYPYCLEANWICVDNWHLTYMGENYKEHYPGETIYSVRGSEIANPTYDGCDVYSGWNGFLFPYWGDSVAAYEKLYDRCLDNYQYLSGLTPGKYLLEVDGMFTFWCWEEDGRMYWHDIRNESNLCHLYAKSSFGDFQVPITRTCYGVKDEKTYSDEYNAAVWHPGWLPNHVTHHIPHVSEDCYRNGMYVEVGEDGELKIGIRESVIEGIPFPNRMAFDNWKLTYLGKLHPAPSGADLYGFRKQFDTHKEYLAFQQQMDDFLQPSSGVDKLDMTPLLRVPGFDSDDVDYVNYWWNNPVLGWGCAEKWNCNYDICQNTSPLPEGYYELRCQGFYRYNDSDGNSNARAVASHNNGTEKLFAYLYANDVSVPLQSIVTDASALRKSLNDDAVWSEHFESGLPFSMYASRLAFDAGLYDDNVVRFHLNGYEPLRFGIRKTELPGADWTIFDNFRLYYYGKDKPADFDTAVNPTMQGASSSPKGIHDLQGRRVLTPRSGLNIVDGKKIAVK